MNARIEKGQNGYSVVKTSYGHCGWITTVSDPMPKKEAKKLLRPGKMATYIKTLSLNFNW